MRNKTKIKKRRPLWPKRGKLTLPNLIKYFKKIEEINSFFPIDLISQREGYVYVCIKNKRITAITTNFNSLSAITKILNKGKFECGMHVGAHIDFFSGGSIYIAPNDCYNFYLSYKQGIYDLSDLIFPEVLDKNSRFKKLHALVCRCFQKIIIEHQLKVPNLGNLEKNPFGNQNWSIPPSVVFQCIEDNPKLVADIKNDTFIC